MRTIKSKFEKDLSRNINKVRRGIRSLESMGLKLAIDKDVETLFGAIVDNVYIIDTLESGTVILQKHLLTIGENK